jgi:hypothetical protein
MHLHLERAIASTRLTQKLCGVPTIGRGSAWPVGGSGGSQRSHISLPSRPECTKWRQNSLFPALIDLKNAKNAIFTLKFLTKYTPKTFLRNTLILNFFVTKGVVELYLFKVSEVINTPSRLD